MTLRGEIPVSVCTLANKSYFYELPITFGNVLLEKEKIGSYEEKIY